MHSESEAAGTEELWHVEVSAGDVKLVTLEQLDEAFNAGLVNDETRVWQEGMDSPARLGDLLGGDSDDESAPGPSEEAAWESAFNASVSDPHMQSEAAYAPPAPQSYASPPEPAPGSMRYQRQPEDTLVGISAAQVAPRTVYGDRPPNYPPAVQSQAAPIHVAQNPAPRTLSGAYPPPSTPSHGAYPPAAAPSYGGYPPVATAAPSYGGYPPVVAAPPSHSPAMGASMPPVSVVPSVVPLAFDLDDDVLVRRSGRGKGLVVGAALLAAAAGVAFAVNSLNAQGATATAAAAQPPTPAPEPPKSHRYDPGDAPVHFKDVAPVAPITTRETEKPTAADQNVAAALGGKAVPKAKPAKVAPSRHASSGGGKSRSAGASAMKGGGSKYDPLNGAL
jgi:hypothetical protein